MSRKEKIRDENIRNWIKYITIFFIVFVILFFSIFFIYNRNLRKEAEASLKEYSTIEKLVPTEDITLSSFSDDKTIEVVLNENIVNEEKSKVVNLNETNKINNNVTVNKNEKEEKIVNLETKKDEIISNENIKKEERKNEETKSEEIVESTVQNTINTENEVLTNTELNSNKELKFETPVVGEIINDYAKDNLIYSKTLEEWGTHLGIDIKAPKTTVVKAAESGTIEKITTDPRFGNSITINHGNGFKTVYSSLLVSDFFKVGETVQKGDNIGTVGDSASFEKAEDSHIHFEIYKDGENVNPTLYLK